MKDASPRPVIEVIALFILASVAVFGARALRRIAERSWRCPVPAVMIRTRQSCRLAILRAGFQLHGTLIDETGLYNRFTWYPLRPDSWRAFGGSFVAVSTAARSKKIALFGARI
jgi:hypothetical protein